MKPFIEEDWFRFLSVSPLALILAYAASPLIAQNEIGDDIFSNYNPVRGRRSPSGPPYSPTIAIQLPTIQGFDPVAKFS